MPGLAMQLLQLQLCEVCQRPVPPAAVPDTEFYNSLFDKELKYAFCPCCYRDVPLSMQNQRYRLRWTCAVKRLRKTLV